MVFARLHISLSLLLEQSEGSTRQQGKALIISNTDLLLGMQCFVVGIWYALRFIHAFVILSHGQVGFAH